VCVFFVTEIPAKDR